MANLKSAIKKIRVDKRRTAANKVWRDRLKKALKQKVAISEIYKIADKMAKKHVISPNKAGRIKSHVAIARQSQPTTT